MMNFRALFLAALLFTRADSLWFMKTENRCQFKGLFGFGDANTDTGAFCFTKQLSPNGMTFFRQPVGRASDGRLYLDFLAQAMGFPYLSPYLNSVLTEYTHGVNFAVAGAPTLMPKTSVFNSGDSPFYLQAQLDQLELFMRRVVELEPRFGHTNLPKSDIFGKSIYIFHIGQTDITTDLDVLGVKGVKQFFPDLVSTISRSVEQVYALGGRTFLVFNLAPVGCYAEFLVPSPYRSSDLDAHGCLFKINNAIQDYNVMLKQKINETRQQLTGATVVYVDIYSVLLDMFQHPESHGLKYGTKACCGYGGGTYNYDPRVFCGHSNEIDGETVNGTACDDPHKYVSWDGIHFTEAANKILASAILNGSFSDPPFPFHHFCDLQPF